MNTLELFVPFVQYTNLCKKSCKVVTKSCHKLAIVSSSLLLLLLFLLVLFPSLSSCHTIKNRNNINKSPTTNALLLVTKVLVQSIMGQTISSTQFYIYGRKHFTRTGYLKHIKEYTEPVQNSPTLRTGIDDGSDNADLTNKVVIVTGANSGLGKMVSTYCAAKGAKLYMVCRDKERGENAKRDIIQQTFANENNVQVVLADVGELEQVRKVATEIQSKETKIHALVCNAGVLLNNRQVTSEGNEVTFACHLLGGTYLLTNLLLPQLQAADNKEGRVVIVTSGGMYNSAIPLWDVMTNNSTPTEIKKYDGTMAYTYAKRGQVVAAEVWSKQYPDVSFVTVHPGWTNTPAVDEAFGANKKYLEPLREPWEGAEGVAWLVQSKRSNIQSGELYLDRKVQVKHLSGPFMSEGTFTKNTPKEITEFMENLKKAAGL